MRAVVFTRKGPPDVLELRDWEEPAAGSGEVPIEVEAAGINFSDVLARVGLYPNAPKPPAVLGYEVAGTVAADAAGFRAGERVAAFVRRGGYAERAVARAGDVLRLPDGVGFEEGAAIPLGFATAYGALVRYGAGRPGERVLVHGAAGGVGSAATLLAKSEGLEVWGTASPGKHGALRAAGVDHPLDYTAAGWDRDLPGFDLVLDALGGASFRRSYRLLRAGGRLVCYGASGVLRGERRNVVTALRTLVRTPRFNPMRQLQDSKAVIGLDTIAIWEEKGSLAELMQPLAPLVESGRARLPVAATFAFEDAAAAHRLMTGARRPGKVVLVPGASGR